MNVTAEVKTNVPAGKPVTSADMIAKCNRVEELLLDAESRDELLKQAGSLLKQNATTFFARILFGESGTSPVFDIIESQFDQPPAHLQKWAVSTAVKGSASGKPAIESAVDQNGLRVHMIGVILSRSESGIELLTGLFSPGSSAGTTEIMLLNSVGHAIRNWDERQLSGGYIQLAEDTAALVDLRSKIEKADTVEGCCGQIANQLKDYLQKRMGQQGIESPTVYAATVDSSGQSKLVAVSGADALPEDASLVEGIESAFNECLCRNKVAIWPAESTDRHAMLCHQRLTRLLQVENLQTVPLHDSEGQIVAAVTLASASPISERVQRLLTSTAQPFGSTLELVKRAEQNQLQKMINSMRDSLKTNKTRTVLKCLAAVLLIGLIPMPYQVATQCELQPLQRRYVCAPFSAHLGDCSVEPGDIVQQNQVLATLDEREIRMELAQVEADFHQATKKMDGLVAAHESGEARLASLEAESLRARNDLLLHRSENLRLKSPISGMVIEGDHRDNLGMPLESGQSLFQISPLDSLNVELFVSDADVRYVESGMSATIRLEAFPFESWSGTIERIQPAAEIHNDESVFVATVQVDNPEGKLRPGMTGSAKISSVWRPIAWNWLHQPVARCMRWLGW